jgi:predicted double-glycine peptidase
MKTYPSPMILRLLLPEPHFVVLLGMEGDHVFVADPAHGNIILRKKAFLQRWHIPGLNEGFVFIATGPNDHVNQARHAQIVRSMKAQLRQLQTVRPPLNFIGR